MPYRRELEVALSIARRAGEIAMHYFTKDTGDAEEKSDLSPVTIADRECERLISRLVSDTFPEDGLVGEEGAFTASRSGRRWIIDPIDGTRDFVRRTPYWAVQIALEVEGQVVLGLIYLPALNEMFHAMAGSGCYWNDERVRASAISRLDKAILMVSGFRHVWQILPQDQVRYLTESCWTVRGYSGCYDVTMLARGKADIWLSGSGMPWDYAPARIIAQECGASFFTLDGRDRIDANHCIICVPGLESELRRILNVPGSS